MQPSEPLDPKVMWRMIGESFTHKPISADPPPDRRAPRPVIYVVADVTAVDNSSDKLDVLSVRVTVTWAGATTETSKILWDRHLSGGVGADKILTVGGSYLFGVTPPPSARHAWRQGKHSRVSDQPYWQQYPVVLSELTSCGDRIAAVMRLPKGDELFDQPEIGRGFYAFLVSQGVLP